MAKKPEETLKEVLDTIDLSEEHKEKILSGEYDPEENLKTPFQDTFISRKLARNDEDLKKEHIGTFSRRVGDFMRKEFGLTQSQIEDKKYEEIFEMGKEQWDNKLKELEGKVENPQTNDEELTKLQESLNKEKEKAKKLEEDLFNTNKEKQEIQDNTQKQLKEFKIGHLLMEKKNKLTFKDDITPLEKEGFNTLINNKYKFDLEEDKLIVTDTDGNKIKNEKNTDYLGVEDILSIEAVNNKIAKMNNSTPEKKKPFTPTPREEGKNQPRLHPNVSKFKERLAS